MTSSFVGYSFVPGPLEGLKIVPGYVFGHADSIDTFFINICWGSKNSIFSNGGEQGDKVKNDQILKLTFFTRLSPSGPRRVEKNHLGIISK